MFWKANILVDAIESILSSSINEVEYFDNAYLLLRNLSGTEESDIDDMKNNRVMLVDEDGDAKFLTKEINDTYIQNNLNRLVADYHKLTLQHHIQVMPELLKCLQHNLIYHLE